MYSQSSANGPTIAVRLRNLSQLFNAMDPSEIMKRDLNPPTEEFIVDRLKQFSAQMRPAIVLHLDIATDLAADERIAARAIRSHFARRADDLSRELQQLFHRGRASLKIGLSALIATFLIGQAIVQLFGEGHIATLLRDCLMIGGWVAMWRPIEIFLYQWRPIVSERLLHEKLSCLAVQVILNRPEAFHNDIAPTDWSINLLGQPAIKLPSLAAVRYDLPPRLELIGSAT